MITLVRVTHQAVVAGGLAILSGTRRPTEVNSGHRVEVAQLESATSHARERFLIVYQTPEHSRTAFGGLVKQEDASLGARRQPFSRELRVLELVLNLDRALQRCLQ